jgi:hypothetical protein
MTWGIAGFMVRRQFCFEGEWIRLKWMDGWMDGWSRDQKEGGIHSPEPNSIVMNIQEDPTKSRNNLMNEWMDEWMNGWMDGWLRDQKEGESTRLNLIQSL